MAVTIDLATETDLVAVHQLIKKIFLEETLTQVTPQGHENFLHFISYHSLKTRLARGSKIWLYKIQTELIGMLEISRSNHIFLYFVKKTYRGQKIGKTLFDYVKSHVSGDITANATDYALPIYLKLGFVHTGLPSNRGGIIVAPVLYKN